MSAPPADPLARPTGAPFLRLDPRAGWRRATPPGERASEQISEDAVLGGLRLGNPALRPLPYAEPGGSFGGLTRPTGLAVVPDGQLFLADPGGNRILRYTTHTRAFQPLWELPVRDDEEPCALPASRSPGAYTLRQPRAVAWGPGDELVVADTGNGRLLFFIWPDLLPRRILPVPGEPWDLAFDRRGRLYVADPVSRRLWRWTRGGQPDRAWHGGVGELRLPRHLALDGEGRVYVVDEGATPPRVLALTARGRVERAWDEAGLQEATLPPPLRLDGDALSLPQEGRAACPALPLPGLRLDRLGRLPGVGAMVASQPLGVRFPRGGRFRTTALDSALFHCAWHRVVLDATLPPATSLTVRTMSAPAPIEDERLGEVPESHWSPPITIGPGERPELLVQSGPGRYLWLELTFTGNGESSPLVRAIELHAPRRSSLAFLPPPFHEDPLSAHFLERFLSYFDTLFAEVEQQIERFPDHLHPEGVPAGPSLAWLASWFDISFLADWPEATRRALVRRAMELHRQRGTREGLRALLALHSGVDPAQVTLIEHFRLRAFPTAPWIAGQPLDPPAGERAHHFTVLLPGAAVPDEEAARTLDRLLEGWKPAHTGHGVRLVEPGIRIGCQSTVGVDMIIGEPAAAPLGEARLGQSGRLAGRAHPPRLGKSALA